jgi:hypothetical protein
MPPTRTLGRLVVAAAATLALALAFSLSTGVPCRAAVVPLSTEEIVRASRLAVRGVVEETRSRWTDDRSTIVTWVAIRIEETYRGAHPRRRLIVEVEGGEVDGIGLAVTDVPSFEKGGRVVVFLEPLESATGRARYRVVGDAQGAYRVGPDGVARKDGFHVLGDASIVDRELPLEDLARRARETR